MTIKENVARVGQAVEQACLEAGRPLESVKVIAVTKYVDSSITRELIEAGVTDIGENRVDKFLDKYHALQDQAVSWHLIGTLQRRKAKDVINFVDYFHALDSLKLAEEIQKRAKKPINCFLQVNVSKEESKHGFYEEEIEPALVELARLDKVRLVGLMTMAPINADKEQLSQIFHQTNAIRERLANLNLPNMPFTELSMGMSGDFKEAIEAGSTFVRIGTAFFSKGE
ncbi:YggS family pyridoxal phosphate-dependent enzyme [Streptococcus suis]